MTTLANERMALGVGGLGSTDEDAEVNLEEADAESSLETMGKFIRRGPRALIELAERAGAIDDPLIRDELARVYTMYEVSRFTGYRVTTALMKGRGPGVEASTGKLSYNLLVRAVADLMIKIAGTGAMGAPEDDKLLQGRRAAEPRRPGHVDLRRHRPDPAQHHQRARARHAQGAAHRRRAAVLRDQEGRLTMDFAFNDEQREIQVGAKRLMEETASLDQVVALSEAATRATTREAYKQIAELGWTGMHIPEEFGGVGLTYVELIVVLEQMGGSLYPSPFFASVCLAANALIEGSKIAPLSDDNAALLAAIAAGEKTATLAYTEPGGKYIPPDVKLTAQARWRRLCLERRRRATCSTATRLTRSSRSRASARRTARSSC